MKQRTSPVLVGSSLVVLSSLFYGSYGVWTRLMGDSFGPFAQAWIKSALVLLLLIAVTRLKGWTRVDFNRDKWLLTGLTVASIGVSAPLYYATNLIGIGVSTLIMYASLLLSLFVFGWTFNHERYTKDKFLATVLALAGLCLAFTPSLQSAIGLLPFILSIIAGICIGLTIVISQNLPYSSSQSTMLCWIPNLPISALLAFILHEKAPSTLLDINWLYLLLFAVISVGASWSVRHGMRTVQAGIAGILGLLEIVFSIAFGIVLFHERPLWPVYVGALLIIAAAAIPYSTQLQRKHRKAVS